MGKNLKGGDIIKYTNPETKKTSRSVGIFGAVADHLQNIRVLPLQKNVLWRRNRAIYRLKDELLATRKI
jgi:hypothetical protein